ncbi:MMPL family transporter [Pseudoroseomonas globiformis]|uniref:MMPL family transporter n=1 Tax=Teichococcus globiformis TaxID=2307229 RepID=A0ABV7FTT3_9PROT
MDSIHSRIVGASTRHPWQVAILGCLLALLALIYTGRHFAMTTDTAELISTDLEWRQREIAFDAAFPQLEDLILVVVDGATPELADDGAQRLTEALRAKPELFRSVRQPEGGEFFARNGLLLLPREDVARAMEQLVRAQPFLGPLAADPSLRGVIAMLSTVLQGVQRGEAPLAILEPAMRMLAENFEAVLQDRPAFFSWRRLIAGDAGREGPPARQVLLVQPVMDFTALQPGAAASQAIRDEATSLGLRPDTGVQVRLTGPVPLSDEEFASLAEDAGLVTGTMLAALIGILWLAVKSWRIVAAILASTLLGLVMTAGLGLLATGRFNLISVAFIPLFVGLGIDFSIQFSVRYLAALRGMENAPAALQEAGRSVGRGLALSAAAIAVGFFAFLPTSYLGVAELGAIAGLGMGIAFLLSVTLLPALLVLFGRKGQGLAEAGFPMLAPMERLLARQRGVVLILAGLTTVGCVFLLPQVRFDFNPLHMRSERVESMATLRDLTADPNRTPNGITVLAESQARAAEMAQRLSALPEVSRALTLADFVPDQQEEKLDLIGDAAMFLSPVLDGFAPAPPPSDEEVVRALEETAALLRSVQGSAGQDGPSAERLANALQGLRDAHAAVREQAAASVVDPLRILLRQISDLLQAGPVTREDLPQDLVADWTTRDGRFRVQAFPQPGSEGNAELIAFSEAVQRIAPEATGVPISIRAAGDMIVTAFLQAGLFSFCAIVALLVFVLRRLRDVVLTMLPVLLSGLLTLATCAAFGLPLNFTNIIALPLLFGIGVAFNIYFVMAWRRGETALLQSSLTRAVIFSALTTATAFGALWLSSHPGTASMGRLLMLSLGWELLVTLLFRPALLARPAAP